MEKKIIDKIELKGKEIVIEKKEVIGNEIVENERFNIKKTIIEEIVPVKGGFGISDNFILSGNFLFGK